MGRTGGIDTRLGHADPVTGCVVQTDEVLRLGDARGNEAVGLGREFAFGEGPERIEGQPGASLGERERVE